MALQACRAVPHNAAAPQPSQGQGRQVQPPTHTSGPHAHKWAMPHRVPAGQGGSVGLRQGACLETSDYNGVPLEAVHYRPGGPTLIQLADDTAACVCKPHAPADEQLASKDTCHVIGRYLGIGGSVGVVTRRHKAMIQVSLVKPTAHKMLGVVESCGCTGPQ